jgi:hypothetical protein
LIWSADPSWKLRLFKSSEALKRGAYATAQRGRAGSHYCP